ncbi:MAG: site-2 protease family protein [Candidatus Hodarchaeota archaeon]
MNGSHKASRISDKIKDIVSQYYKIVLFEESPHRFEPIIVIDLTDPQPQEDFEKIQSELKKIGFQIKLHHLKEHELKQFNLKGDEKVKLYEIKFEAKEFGEKEEKLKKRKIIQLVLLSITSLTIIISGFLYVYLIDPYYGGFGKPFVSTFFAIFSYCLGMFLIVVVHEFGHIYFSRKHKLRISLPYLIPGPPPLGMFGAFVSIKDEPHTRNQKYDVAIGGIVFGIMISLILIVIGLLLSIQMDTEQYLQLRADYYGSSPAEEAKYVHEHMNFYNFLFLATRFLFFEQPSYRHYYGCYLPTKIIIIHPLAFAGWIGLILSGLNLIPLPFLDGGHIFRTIFPNPAAGIIGMIIGFLIFLSLHPNLLVLSILPSLLLCCSNYMIFQSQREDKKDEFPNPTIPLTKSRKISALLLIPIFILLYPLTYDNIIFGFGI